MPDIRQIRLSASRDRLEQLIAKRMEPGADKEQIDARIWDCDELRPSRPGIARPIVAWARRPSPASSLTRLAAISWRV